MDLEKLKREEAELEKAWKGEENPSEEPEAPSQDTFDLDDDDNDNDDVDESTEEVTTQDTKSKPEPEQNKRVSWKKRFATYKASTDSTIYNLRQENSNLKGKLADSYEDVDKYKSLLAEAKQSLASTKDPYADVISEEDRELLGDEAINTMKKIMDTRKEDPRVTELQEELNRLKKEKIEALRKEREDNVKSSQTNLRAGLLKAVPNFESIDQDPEFHEYLQGIDEYSGVPRSTLFSSNVTARDVKGVARFYLDYVALKPKTREEILSSKVTPKGNGNVVNERGNQKQKKTYTISEYENFMDSVMKGKFQGSKADAKKMEMMYDKAFAEGRVVNG